MKKLIAVAFILLSTLAVSQTISTIKHPTANSWSGRIKNITGSIPLATLFTPPSTGQYRLSTTVVLHLDAISDEQWNVIDSFTDGAGFEYVTVSSIDANGISTKTTSDVRTFMTAAQTPITYSVGKTDTDKSFIDIFWTIELLVAEQE